MKIFLCFCCFIFNCIAYTQTPFPAGVANTYSLGEKESYNGFMYMPATFAPDGTVYTCTYNGNVEIHGNNFKMSLDSLKKLSSYMYDFKIIDSSEVWAFGLKNVAVLKNNKVVSTLPVPQNCVGIIKNIHHHSLYFITRENNKVAAWLYNGKSLIKTGATGTNLNNASMYVLETQKKEAFFLKLRNDTLHIYKFDVASGIFHFKKSYAGIIWVSNLNDENNFFASGNSQGNKISYLVKNGRKRAAKEQFNSGNNDSYFLSGHIKEALYRKADNKYYTVFIDSNLNLNHGIPFICNDDLNTVNKNLTGHLYFAYTGNRLMLISPFIKKYPGLFNNSHSAAIFTVSQDGMGRIWAGSYQNDLSIIDKGTVTHPPGRKFKMMNGGSYYNNKMYLAGDGAAGLLQYDMKGNARQVQSGITGYYTYISKNKEHFYYATPNYSGLWQTTAKSLQTLKPQWNKIDSLKGNKLRNLITITEDTLGRIWSGHPKAGIVVYDPATDKAQTWFKEKNETRFGGFSSITDKYGTVWMGGIDGLWYYNDYKKEAAPKNCKPLYHPLVSTAKQITALTIYDNWLVIAAYDKILLLDLKSFYENKKTVVRYLNLYETAFTSFTEQNTMLTAKDNTVWFSTCDMLYHWDVKNWLALKTYLVKTNILITGGNKEIILKEDNNTSFKPGFTSFDIHVQYVSPDNMPRYASAALIKAGDSILLPAPGLQSIYNIKNIAAGNYHFVLDIYEMDGKTARYIYPVTIKKHLWQQWWFWALLSVLASMLLLNLYNLKQKKRVAEEKAKTAAAELQSFKSEQEKKLANLQLITLSSQFRPHFILNALNSIGAQMDDQPGAETVLSRLGESVNLIFNHAQQQKILHPFQQEWTLVKNVIHIHTLMYLKQLEVIWPPDIITESIKTLQLPLGILQIPVENALLHGLSNRENGPWILQVQITENDQFVHVEIRDNGVGRKRSALLSNHTKHGTGTKNQAEIIAIINAVNKQKITIIYADDIYKEGKLMYGTVVKIEIPKHLNYTYG